MAHVTIDITKSQQSEAMRKLRATQAAAHDALQRLAKDAREAIGVAEHWAEVIDDLTDRAAKAEKRAQDAEAKARNAETSLQHEKHSHSMTRKEFRDMRDARDKLLLKYGAVGALAPASVQKVDAVQAHGKASISNPQVQNLPKYIAGCGYGPDPWYVVQVGSADLHCAVTGIPNKLSAVLLAKLITEGQIDLRPGPYSNYNR